MMRNQSPPSSGENLPTRKKPDSTSQSPTEIQGAIAIEGLCFSYPDKPKVLQDITLNVNKGERVGLIGANGAGKTTLFLTICGVLTRCAGEIRVFDKPIIPGEFRPEIGLVFQNPSDQLFCASVWDDVAFGPQNMGLSESEIETLVTETLTLTGVLELADRPPHHLSGGQKQMVAIAGVLAMQPQVVLYDEPSANLDLQARRRIINFLQAARETLVISSHDLELILEVCDRVILMDEGRIVTTGTPSEVMGDEQLMLAHGLEKPHSLIPHRHNCQ